MGEKISENAFLTELYKRTSSAPIKSNSGNEYISVDMRDTSKEFIQKLAKFIEDRPETFRVLVRGLDIYVEVMGGRTYLDAYKSATKYSSGKERRERNN